MRPGRTTSEVATRNLAGWVYLLAMDLDPTVSNADSYRTVFENERVRVLEYLDSPGHETTPHRHPDTVMYTLTSFRRRLCSNDQEVVVDMAAGAVRWLAAQEHSGENIGDTDTHTILVELKEPRPTVLSGEAATLGPSG